MVLLQNRLLYVNRSKMNNKMNFLYSSRTERDYKFKIISIRYPKKEAEVTEGNNY